MPIDRAGWVSCSSQRHPTPHPATPPPPRTKTHTGPRRVDLPFQFHLFAPHIQGAGEVMLRSDQGGYRSTTLVPVLPLGDRSTGGVITPASDAVFHASAYNRARVTVRHDPLDQLFIRSNIVRPYGPRCQVHLLALAQPARLLRHGSGPGVLNALKPPPWWPSDAPIMPAKWAFP